MRDWLHRNWLTKVTLPRTIFKYRQMQLLGPSRKTIQSGGTSATTITVNVRPLSGRWPPPRIEDITYRFISVDAAQHTMSLILYIAVANVDAQAVVKIHDVVKESLLYAAIPSDYFPNHDARTYKYPVYHYGQLIASLGEQMGSTVSIEMTNIDGLTDTKSFRVPASPKIH